MKPLRAGVIGVGYLGRFHAQKYAAMEGVELVGVVDLDQARSRAVGAELNVPAFDRAEALLGRVEAVSVVVPASEHHRVAGPMLEHGVHCLVEKPMAATLVQADELVDLAERRGLVLQVGHLERFNPAVAAVLDRQDSPPVLVEARRLTPLIDRGRDVDVVLDLMIHDIDILLKLVGEIPTDIRAVGAKIVSDGPDVANARLEFPGGAVANLTAGRISSKPCRQIQIFRADSHQMVDCAARTLTTFTRKETGAGRETRTAEVMPGVFAARQEFSQNDPLADELRAFTSAVAAGVRPAVDGREGRLALAVALDIASLITARRSGEG